MAAEPEVELEGPLEKFFTESDWDLGHGLVAQAISKQVSKSCAEFFLEECDPLATLWIGNGRDGEDEKISLTVSVPLSGSIELHASWDLINLIRMDAKGENMWDRQSLLRLSEKLTALANEIEEFAMTVAPDGE